jgi:hypothetical protein
MSDDFDMEEASDDSDEEAVDIRALVGKKDKESPPAKKQRKS